MGTSLTFVGPVGQHYSVSKVVRETALALNRMGYEVGLYDPKAGSDLQESKHWAHPQYRASCRNLVRNNPGELNYALTDFGLPEENFTKIPGRKVRGFLYDEFKANPNAIKIWNEHFEFLVASSKMAQEWGQSHGLRDVRYAPLGVNTLDYYPVEKSPDILAKFRWVNLSDNPVYQQGYINSETLVLVHNGTIQQRKGTAELVKAYRETFNKRNNVVLLIQGSNAPWQDATMKTLLGNLDVCPPIAWCDQDLSIAEQRRLFALANLGAYPNYVEGFGLVALEAMACGVPVVIPAHSGNLEISDSRATYLLRGGKQAPHPKYAGFDWWVPNTDEISDMLWQVYEDRDTLRQKALVAAEDAGKHKWEVGAKRFAEWLDITHRRVDNDGACTVVTLARNNASMTRDKALATVAATWGATAHHTLVDNGSSEQAAMKAIAEEMGVKLIRVDDPNKYGIVATNLAWCPGTLGAEGDYAHTEFCARVDNDVEVKPDWLKKAVAHLRANPQCGAVGSVGFYPPDASHKEWKLWSAGWTWEPGTAWGARLPDCDQPPNPSHWVDKRVWSVCFSCVVIRTELVLQLGGIWWKYNPCWYDDTDLNMAIWNAGYEVHHLASTAHTNERSATIGNMPNRQALMNEKKGVFESYWKWLLEGDEPRVQNLIGKVV